MSAPETLAPRAGPPGVALASCAADIIEIAAFRACASGLERLAAERGVVLPGPGRVVARSGHLALCVRPARWLLLAPPAAPGASAALWEEVTSGQGAALDLSAALRVFSLAGPAVPEMLARACRLDLDASAFPAGCAAATIMVQVPVILARLTPGMLLLSPATTARHLHEWLVETSKPFGLMRAVDATLSQVCGDNST